MDSVSKIYTWQSVFDWYVYSNWADRVIGNAIESGNRSMFDLEWADYKEWCATSDHPAAIRTRQEDAQ